MVLPIAFRCPHGDQGQALHAICVNSSAACPAHVSGLEKILKATMTPSILLFSYGSPHGLMHQLRQTAEGCQRGNDLRRLVRLPWPASSGIIGPASREESSDCRDVRRRAPTGTDTTRPCAAQAPGAADAATAVKD